ncbi:MAG TPA: four-carbon acid sugar kinase family protein [Acidobacteriaceae bacterium]|jgi:uncharacterized protein YgbK (DUF1537 family)|nr:four-carbon acid sugar kinase family protein [Acidobacteriaceae bacterium]
MTPGKPAGEKPASRSKAARLVVVADDLTGACDAAVAFTRVSDSVCVRIDGDLAGDAEITGVSTESRDLPEDEAERRVCDLIERLPADVELFKKVDSVLRGNTYAEVRAALRCAQYDLAVVAPAYPGLGRRMREGVMQIQDAAGDCTIPVAEMLSRYGCRPSPIGAGLSREEIEQEMKAALERSTNVVLCDAWEEHDLTHTVQAARSLGVRFLWIGSGGLAHALAPEFGDSHPGTFSKCSGDVLFFIGSDHPVTQAQLAKLQDEGHAVGCRQVITAGSDHLLLRVVRGQTSREEIRRSLAGRSPATIGCLFITGGDTASLVCDALGIRALRMVREFSPGVPVAVAEGGPWEGVTVVLKSGGFGEERLLCHLLEEFGGKSEVAVS